MVQYPIVYILTPPFINNKQKMDDKRYIAPSTIVQSDTIENEEWIIFNPHKLQLCAGASLISAVPHSRRNKKVLKIDSLSAI